MDVLRFRLHYGDYSEIYRGKLDYYGLKSDYAIPMIVDGTSEAS